MKLVVWYITSKGPLWLIQVNYTEAIERIPMNQPPPYLPSSVMFPFSAILWMLIGDHSGLVDLGQRNWVGM